MRILISALWAAESPSGICRTVTNLVRSLNLSDRGLHVSIALGRWQRKYFEELLDLNSLRVDVHEIDIPNRSYDRNAWCASGLSKLSRKVSADLVHLSHPLFFIRRQFPCPVITTLHDLYPFDRPKNFGFPHVIFNRLSLRQALHQSDRIVCVSTFTLNRLRKHFLRIADAKAVCIQNAVYLSEPSEKADSFFSFPYVLAVAQHRANKNLDLLLDAFARCKQLRVFNDDIKLVIVGKDGPETARLHEKVDRLTISQDVLFLSGITDAELTNYYRYCELFFSLSDIEGFDLPVAEALFLRKPIVISDIKVHREIAGEHAEYVDLGGREPVELVVNAVRAAKLRPIPPIGAVAHLSLPTIGREYLKIYREVVGSLACGIAPCAKVALQ